METTNRHNVAIDKIDKQIAALEAKKQALLVAHDTPWPKRLTVYAYCSDGWQAGEGLGLTGEALSLFADFDEVQLEVDVAEDGMVTIVSCNGMRLVQAKE